MIRDIIVNNNDKQIFASEINLEECGVIIVYKNDSVVGSVIYDSYQMKYRLVSVEYDEVWKDLEALVIANPHLIFKYID